MNYHKLHPWNLKPAAAKLLQYQLGELVKIERPQQRFSLIAGADLAYVRETNLAVAAIMVFSLPKLEILAQVTACQPCECPYIPGLLTFREGPVLLAAFEKIEIEPEVIIFDGQGIAHPRGLGLASHMGLLLDKPTIGCAKKPLVGDYSLVGEEPGEVSFMHYESKIIGAALRTKRNVKPIFISPGHKIDLVTSIDLIWQTCQGYRLPGPVRQAHLLANKAKNRICPGSYTL